MILNNVEITGMRLGSNVISRAILGGKVVYESISQPDQSKNLVPQEEAGPWGGYFN